MLALISNVLISRKQAESWYNVVSLSFCRRVLQDHVTSERSSAADFDSLPFRGKYYNWKPYTGGESRQQFVKSFDEFVC